MTHTKKKISASLLAASAFLFTSPAFAQTPIFKTAQTYAVGSNPNSVAVRDFNGDGKMDLAVANEGDPVANVAGSISILFGNGDGTFQPAVDLTPVKNPVTIVAGDFNGDGKDDFAVTVWTASNSLSIFLSNGDGTFRAATPAPLPGAPWTIVAADFNGDHNLDLAVVTSANLIRVLLGNGDGTFSPHGDYHVVSLPTALFVAADINGDGVLDLYNPPTVLFGKGDGTFPEISTINLGGVYSPTGAIGDFNHDGLPDLVGDGPPVECSKDPIKYCPGPVNLFLGTGGGGFQVGESIANDGFPSFQLGGDFDGDGNADAVASMGLPQIAVYPGNGDGTFRDPAVFAPGSLPLFSTFIAADLNGDKAPDLIAAGSQWSNSIAVLVNSGPDFTISASALNPTTLSAGQSASASLALNAIRNYGNTVSLTCAVQPAQPGAPTCSLSSASVSFDANRQAGTTLIVTAGSSHTSLNSPQPFGTDTWVWLPVAGFAFLGTGFGGSSSRRRRSLMLPIGAILFLGIIMQTACGGGGSNGGPKSTAYTVTVTAASGATQHSTTVNLAVQ